MPPREQIAVRLPEGMTDRIDKRAKVTGRSRNEWIIRALEWALEQPVTTRTKREQV